MAKEEAVLLIDWDNLASAITNRGKLANRKVVDSIRDFAFTHGGQRNPKGLISAPRLERSIDEAARDYFFDQDLVRSTKEQADISLAVNAMDRLHEGYRRFVLVTGDQDFIPLIHRLLDDDCQITVIFGDENRLSQDLKRILNPELRNPNIQSLAIDAICDLVEPRPISKSNASFLALLELQRTGQILGGPNSEERARRLQEWAVLEDAEDSSFRRLIEAFAVKVKQPNAAVKDQGSWVARPQTRTYLNLEPIRVTELFAADHVLRETAARPGGRPERELRTGPLATDDGTLLASVCRSLKQIGRIRQQANGELCVCDEYAGDGYVEYLWRVYAFVMALTFEQGSKTIPTNRLTSSLTGGGVGQGPKQKTPGRATAVEKYARAFGIIDVVAENGKRVYTVSEQNAVGAKLENAYAALYQLHGPRNEAMAEDDLRARMSDYDEGRAVPVFGWTARDQHRVLRVLRQSGLIAYRATTVVVKPHKWGDALGHYGR